ncbi:MAG: alpha/beta fold hydrolase [Anaerolineae bacterium]
MSARVTTSRSTDSGRAAAEPGALHVAVTGAGPAILFLHGVPTDGRLWRPLVRRLRARHTCVVVDLPGCGRSAPLPGGRLEPVGIVQALEALRARLDCPSAHRRPRRRGDRRRALRRQPPRARRSARAHGGAAFRRLQPAGHHARDPAPGPRRIRSPRSPCAPY